ncbi:Hypothetical predicted protein, partial [Paramuricea clavata]
PNNAAEELLCTRVSTYETELYKCFNLIHIMNITPKIFFAFRSFHTNNMTIHFVQRVKPRTTITLPKEVYEI